MLTQEELDGLFVDSAVPGLDALTDDQRHRAQRILRHGHHFATQLVHELGGLPGGDQLRAAVNSAREACVHAIADELGG